ncbi:MAG TPA: amidohydrolase [Thermoplasmata archaeon]|nr:amidohydrolase [Thermoplasmata archaeon]
MTEARRFSGGRILTGRRTVESILVQDGRVVAAGSEEETRRASPSGTEVLPLDGRAVIPGLIDAHLHLVEMTRVREGLDLHGARSIRELQQVLEGWARAHPTGALVGRGWSSDRFEERRDPSSRDLDRVVSDRPVILYHASGHSAVLNRAAVLAAGFSDATADPAGGRLGRDSDAVLDGVVYERALDAVGRLASQAEPPDPASLARTLRIANTLGLTTVASMNTPPEELHALQATVRSHPTLRIVCYGRLSRWAEFTPSDWDNSGAGGGVSLVGIKAFADGAFGPRTAWLTEPYADRTYEVGVPTLRGAELAAFLARCRAQGCAPAIHAIGDAALAEVLHALEREGTGGTRPARIEHASLAPPAVYPLLDRVRPALVVQPGFVWTDWWLGQRLGTTRARWAYPFRTLLGRGHHLAGSSDAPFDSADPWVGLAAALYRTSPEGGSANATPEEALTAPQALELYTRNAARALGEQDVGTLEPGFRADLVVTGAPDLERAIALGSKTVLSTWVGGVCVFDRAADGEPQPS